MHTTRGDGVAGIKRRRRDLSSDGVRNLATASGRGRLKEDLESSTWRRRQDFKATPPHMGDANPIHTLEDYSKPSHEGYMNTIELPVGNNVCKIDRAASGKLRDKNINESWEIIKNLALYDHEDWNDSKEFVKPVKAISTPQRTSKTPDRRLLELEDQINFLLKGSRPTPRPSSTHIPQAYAEAIYSNPRSQNQNRPPKQNPFPFHEPTEQEEINDKMAEMFELLKELTTSRAPKKVLIREEAKSPITKNVNSMSLARGEEERNGNDDVESNGGINGTDTEMLVKEAEKETEAENGINTN
ncbi:hypothetical protein Tco_0516306 [Tanacetum coccineum]